MSKHQHQETGGYYCDYSSSPFYYTQPPLLLPPITLTPPLSMTCQSFMLGLEDDIYDTEHSNLPLLISRERHRPRGFDIQGKKM